MFTGGWFVGFIRQRVSTWLFREPDPGGLNGAISLLVAVGLMIAVITGVMLALIGIGSGVSRLID